MANSLILLILCLGIALANPISRSVDLGLEPPEKPPVGGDPFYILYENEAPGTVNFTAQPNSPSLEVSWRQSAYFQVGKGWRRGLGRNVTYTGYYQPQGNSLLGITGWTKVSMIFYVAVV
jgi:hypothetical protein